MAGKAVAAGTGARQRPSSVDSPRWGAALRRPGRAALSPGARNPLDRRRRRLFWPFLAPALALYVVFFVGPALASLWISFHRWDGVGEMEPRGLENYRILFDDSSFLGAFANTMTILVLVGATTFALSFALTMVLRDMRGRRFVRAVLFFPHIVAPVVLSVLWGFLFRSPEGLVNSAWRAVSGADGPNWLGDHLFAVIVLGLVWVNTGFYTTVIMAGVDRIPPDLYEDCALAGATGWQRFRHVTLPLSWEVVATAAVLWTISSLKIFEFVYAFGGTTNDMPPLDVWNSALFVYGTTFGGRSPQYQYGYASASAVVTLAAVTVLVVLLRRLMRRETVQF
ncbi:carbohydrate ABC transporter permease [Streptoalloteichus hindustanus]|uniref:Carbohydrate ABC transporter membrane protein 1, CUT1 family n=1 Tax=Streptoalloteichus hindustanus TaxID=2017 RepID=A0A1M4UGH8_STRHI|nr:sugar ABC transporter permease [Streptoalloteichus hindustanus]SHE55738.1 carbohydrate ABC transporter membrane protein 1, CUT1 family [Streptoalloteichus hindustanus]